MEHDEEGLIFIDKGGYFGDDIKDEVSTQCGRIIYEMAEIETCTAGQMHAWRLVG